MKPTVSQAVRGMRNKLTGEWLADARRRIAERQLQTGGPNKSDAQEASLAAQLLLASVLGKGRAWLLAHPETEIDPGQQARLQELLEKFAEGVPLPYLLGQWEFYGLKFAVSPAVLIPRPETEMLVERAIAWLRDHPGRRFAADIGTGSGCIAVSIAKEIPDVLVTAVDRSRGALQIARQNAVTHGVVQRIRLIQGDLLSAAAGHFDLVCANLRYIPRAELAGLPAARHEPRLALDGGPDGLAVIRGLLADAHRWLAPGGLLLLEMQFDQGEAIQKLARQFLPAARVTIHPDLAGLPRMAEIQDMRAI